MTQLYTPDGKPATFADQADAMAALRAGKVGVPSGQTIKVAYPDGEVYEVPASEWHKLPDDARLQTQAEADAEARAAAEVEASGLREKRRGTGLGTFERVVDAATGLGRLAAGGLTGLAANPGAIAGPLGAAFGGTEEAARAQGREDAWTLGLGKVARKVATEALYGKAAAAELVREKALDRELAPEAYQKGSVEGGIESAVASSALGQPGAGLSRFAAGPQAIPELAGALAEAGLAKMGLTAGQTAAGHALKGALSMGVRGGVEGAIAGGASELTEEMFGDPEVVGSKVWLAAGKGALAGFATGGVMGAAAPAIGRAFGRAADSTTDTVSRAEMAARAKAPELAHEQAFRQLSQHPAAKLTREAEARIAGGTKAVGEFAMRSGIVDTSNFKAAATNNGTAAMLARAEKVVDDVGAEIGERMRASGAVISGKEIDAIAKRLIDAPDETGLPLSKQVGRGGTAKVLRDYVDEFMANISGSSKPLPDVTIPIHVDATPPVTIPISVKHAPAAEGGYLDANGYPRGPKGRLMPAETDIEATIKGLPERNTVARHPSGLAVDNAGRVLPENTISMADAYAQRRALDQKIYKDYSALEAKGPMELMRKFRSEYDDLLMRKMTEAGETAAPGVGPTAGRTLQELKADYQKAVTAKKILEDGAVKDAKNRNISLTDYISGAAAYGVLGDPISAMAGAYAHKQIRTRGNAVAAYALGRIGDMQMVAKAAERADKLIAQAADGASGAARHPYRSAPPSASLAKRFDAARDHVRELSRQSDAVKARAAELSTIPGAPNVSRAFSSAITRAAAELVAKLPDDPPQMSPLHKTRPSTDEMRAFLSTYDAVTNPEGTLREVAAGSLDPAKTSVLKRVAPSAYLDLRDEVEKRAIARIERGDIPKQADLMKLKLAFDITLDPTMTPEALASQHAAMAAGGGNDGAQAPQENGGRRGRASSMKQQREPTGADRFDR